MEIEEIIEMKLEHISKFLERKVEELEQIKRRMDEIIDIIKQVDEKEEEFLKVFSEVRELNEKLLLYFNGIDVCKDQLISFNEELKKIELEYNEEEVSLRDKISSMEFNEKNLSEYNKHLTSLLDDKIKIMSKLRDIQREIFCGSVERIKSKLYILHRLVDALIKKVEKTLEKHYLKEYLDEKQNQIQQTEAELPLEVEDLIKRKTEELRGLYARTENNIFSCREDLRKFAIENGLLEKNEIAILEIIYEMRGKEFEFSEIIEFLKKEELRVSDEDIQTILLSLSKKGFLILKVIA